MFAEPDPYDADDDGLHTASDAALLLRSDPWKAAELLLDILGIRSLPQT